jgi:hypothetical protein
VFELWKKRA